MKTIEETFEQLERKLEEQGRQLNLLLSEVRYTQMLVRAHEKVNTMESKRDKKPAGTSRG